jgi:hypothetical protein
MEVEPQQERLNSDPHTLLSLSVLINTSNFKFLLGSFIEPKHPFKSISTLILVLSITHTNY